MGELIMRFSKLAIGVAVATIVAAALTGLDSPPPPPPPLPPNSIDALNYTPVFRTCTTSLGHRVTQIRKFEIATTVRNPEWALVVDSNLHTSIVSASDLKNCADMQPPKNVPGIKMGPISGGGGVLAETPYLEALADISMENIDALQNAGATHKENDKNEVYLTVDMCPSHKKMDVELFQKIQGGVKPVPVAISLSGLWLLDHAADFATLQKMQKDGELDITWVNHTYSHPYRPGTALQHNFVLESGVSLANEVFENEKLMLKYGITPTVFFRFPGLVSDSEDIEMLRGWGLIPLGANAWLALGEKPLAGSFILVHGNGNEPEGLKLLYKDMTDNPEMKKQFTDIYNAF